MTRRVQLKRTRGWRLPPNTVVVSRPTRWGNPFRVPPLPREDAVALFRAMLAQDTTGLREAVQRELCGKDLACWCPLVDAEGRPVPCHADVLLEVANGGRDEETGAWPVEESALNAVAALRQVAPTGDWACAESVTLRPRRNDANGIVDATVEVSVAGCRHQVDVTIDPAEESYQIAAC